MIQLFANLHTHTDYSVLDGMMTARTAFEAAKKLQYSAMAITEHGNMSSLFIALNAAKEFGVKFIPGIEFNIKDSENEDTSRHLVVIASNHSGLKSIMNVSYASYGRSVDNPYIMWEDLDHLDKSGVYVLSGCVDGYLAIRTLLYGSRVGESIMDRFITLFGERFLVEVNIPYDDRQSDVNALLSDLATKKGVRRVLTLDSHFASDDDKYLFNIYLAIQHKGSIYEKDSVFYSRPSLISEDEIRRLAGQDMYDAIDLSASIANQCEDPAEYLKPADKFLMPAFDVRSTADYDEFLTWKAGNSNV